MAIEAGDIVWTIKAKIREFRAALKDAKADAAKLGAAFMKNSRAIGAGMTVAGGVITGVMAKVVTDFARTGDEIQKMAISTGWSTEALSELGFAAERGGASLEDIEKATKKLSQTIFEAGEGTSTYVDALHGVGLEYDDIAGKSPEEQFLIVANALAEVEDQTTKVALAQEIFGRAGTKLLPMLADGAEGLEKMRQKARDLGLVFSQEAADKAAEFQDALTNLQGAMQGLVIQIGPIIADVLIPMIEKMVDAAKATADWAEANPGLAEAITKIAGALGAMLLVLGPVVFLLPGIAAGVSLFGVVSGTASIGVTALAIASTALSVALGLVLIVAAGLGLTAIAAFVMETLRLAKATLELVSSNRAVGEGLDRLIESYERTGIAIDRTRLEGLNYQETQDELARQLEKQRGAQRDANVELVHAEIALRNAATAARETVPAMAALAQGNNLSAMSAFRLVEGLEAGTISYFDFATAMNNLNAVGSDTKGTTDGLGGSMKKAASAASGVTASVEDVIAALAEMGIEVPPNIKGLGQLAKQSSSFADSQSRQATATNNVAKALEAVLVHMGTIFRSIAITGPQVWAMGGAYFRWASGASRTSTGLEPIAGLINENSVAMWGINPILWNTASGYQALGRSAGFAADELERVASALGSAGGFASGGVVPGFASGGTIPGFANGGRVVQVGEAGPELAFLPVGTQILSHGESKQALSEAAQASRPISMTATFGDIIVQGVENPEQTAKELVDFLKVEMGRQFEEAKATE